MPMNDTVVNTEVKLVIVLHPDGRIELNGPIQNKLLCYGLLEAARDAIQKFGEGSLVAAAPPDLKFLSGRR